jgi:hypothetical protein
MNLDAADSYNSGPDQVVETATHKVSFGGAIRLVEVTAASVPLHPDDDYVVKLTPVLPQQLTCRLAISDAAPQGAVPACF